MSEDTRPVRRTQRRAARRKANFTRILPWLAAAILAVAGLLLLPGALRSGDLPAATFAPVSTEAAPAADKASAYAPDGAASPEASPATGTQDLEAKSFGAASEPEESSTLSSMETESLESSAPSGTETEALESSALPGTDPETSESSIASETAPSPQAEEPAGGTFGDPSDAPQTGGVSEKAALPGKSPAPSPAAEPVRLTISAAGDCTLGGDASSRSYAAFASAYKKNGAEYFLKNVREIFAADDLTIVNLEGPLTTKKRFRVKEFAFKGHPAYGKILIEGSVEAANLANNHAKDYYGAGLQDTAAALKAAGIARFGWGKTEILEIKGVKVGLCGFGVWYVSTKEMQRQIKALKAKCDLVIASIHGGEEGEGRALKVQKTYDRAAVQAGASLVLGHHPHVVGGIEKYKGATIVYSLGNFCFGGNLNPDDKDTFIFQQTFEITADGPVAAGELVIPCSISGSKSKNDYQPVPLEGDDALRVLSRIQKLSKGFDQPVDLSASRERLKAAG